MKFGKKNYYEALAFLEELEEENDIELDFYKAVLEENTDDEFELTYYSDENNWSLENVTECSVVIDHQILEACLEEER